MSGANESDGQRFKRGPLTRAQGALLGYRLVITVGSVSILGVESSVALVCVYLYGWVGIVRESSLTIALVTCNKLVVLLVTKCVSV